MCKISPILGACLLAASLPLLGADSETASRLVYSVFYQDTEGVTHFRDDQTGLARNSSQESDDSAVGCDKGLASFKSQPRRPVVHPLFAVGRE